LNSSTKEDILKDKIEGISVVIPLLNEEDNIRILNENLVEVLSKLPYSYEIIYVNDGSTDGTSDHLQDLAKESTRIKVLQFTRNFGQTAALSCGIEKASMPTIITMDGDLQNDPEDIPRLIDKLSEGYAMVSGWRFDRKDDLIRRKIPSIVANWLISIFSGAKLHDYGCTLKIYRGHHIKGVHLYGEMHRFVPALIYREGGKIAELKVNHRPRSHGKSKYGMSRVIKVFLDLFLLKFISGYSTRPIHFFGFFGMTSLLLGFGVGLFATISKYFMSLEGLLLLPLLVLSVLLLIVGVQTVLIGLVAEILIRIYHETLSKPTYVVEKTINIKTDGVIAQY
jgi:glycosyltransferase involved in cell wall biosynthesis